MKCSGLDGLVSRLRSVTGAPLDAGEKGVQVEVDGLGGENVLEDAVVLCELFKQAGVCVVTDGEDVCVRWVRDGLPLLRVRGGDPGCEHGLAAVGVAVGDEHE